MMYQGKYRKSQPSPARQGGKKPRQWIAALVAGLLVLTAASGATIAWLIDRDEVKNTFAPSAVTVEVTESMNFDAMVKSDVAIKNSSQNPDLACYIRAVVVINWVREENGVYYNAPVAPEEGTDYTISYNNGGSWIQAADGFWYFTEPVDVGTSTDVLINSCALVNGAKYETEVDGETVEYHLSVEIVADGIQAMPAKAVTNAWASGVASVGTDNILQIRGGAAE